MPFKQIHRPRDNSNRQKQGARLGEKTELAKSWYRPNHHGRFEIAIPRELILAAGLQPKHRQNSTKYRRTMVSTPHEECEPDATMLVQTPADYSGANTNNTNNQDSNDDSDDDDDLVKSAQRKRGRRPKDTPATASPNNADDDETIPYRRTKRGRPPGRPRGGPNPFAIVPLDDLGNEQTVIDDEIYVAEEDPAGEQKVNKQGHLNGGREYRCRTFTILGKGSRLYMLSTEPARAVGYRDSYLFFLKHKSLYKVIIDDEEKRDLIARDILPHSYKGRVIGVVTARSVFRAFGAKIIVAGKKIVDDYWESVLRKQGVVEGELADPDDKLPPPGMQYNRNQYVAWHGASQVYHQNPVQQVSFQKKRRVVVTDQNWLLEHARAASRYNSDIRLGRLERFATGSYEPHTHITFFPASTQPTAAQWKYESPNDPSEASFLHVNTLSHQRTFTLTGPGILDIPESIYEGCDNKCRLAIEQRKEVERKWNEEWYTGERKQGHRGVLKIL
ncbi:Chromatin structure-remodeling complex subunit rsc7 [Neolecta irregularis DAH-3]|uniref:Chromatin structure-remodeling complex subunit rsc7 n=1 Tax=Neolecta irregularis (strain DAH-3) TaxID=1198029 RepID=A0A1U7LNE7_NEOID|nr:Chromatin structure-remodeling complex subunit rsc7 [Neolecta irregularis DAH-3]|eukprot:OLL24174.1 Chromatin structure-remodeling complex subunit rsc7 [Neolecta irregularis DAH-3]